MLRRQADRGRPEWPVDNYRGEFDDDLHNYRGEFDDDLHNYRGEFDDDLHNDLASTKRENSDC